MTPDRIFREGSRLRVLTDDPGEQRVGARVQQHAARARVPARLLDALRAVRGQRPVQLASVGSRGP